jgi:NH3-dependent NAD+ synthetase
MTKIKLCKLKKVNAQIVKCTRPMRKMQKLKGFVVGISGGVDSAVTSHCVHKLDWLFMHRNADSSTRKPC